MFLTPLKWVTVLCLQQLAGWNGKNNPPFERPSGVSDSVAD